MYGKVTRYLHDRKFGFIRGDDGNTYFIHDTKLNGEYIDAGYYVFFKPFQNDRSDYNAKDIIPDGRLQVTRGRKTFSIRL